MARQYNEKKLRSNQLASSVIEKKSLIGDIFATIEAKVNF